LKNYIAPDLTGQSVMVVAIQGIEADLITRRLQSWGGQTCLVSDTDIAAALLPERNWHAVLVDDAIGRDAATAMAKSAQSHSPRRIVLVTPTTRHELQPNSPFTGYLVKPLRAASLAARLAVTPDVAAPALADDAIAEPIVSAPAAASKGLSILVAEDNEINALLMRSLLTKSGHRVVIAIHGAAALESWLAARAAGAPYDLILMDLQMPQLDGIEAAKRIRAHESAEPGLRTPILALTANTLVEDRYACFEAGMDGFLIKPLDRDKLHEALVALAAARHVAA
jgi:CheY-like chemotaxis protein